MRFVKSFLILSGIFLTFFSYKPLFAKNSKNKLISKGYSAHNKKIGAIESLSLSGMFNVYLSQKDRPSLRIEGSEADLDQVSIEEHGKKLYIKMNKKSGFALISKKVDVYLSINNLKEIDMLGSVQLMSENEFHVDDLNITSKGTGKTVLALNAQNLKIDISGSGHIILAGYAQHQNVSIQGSGSYKANKLVSGSASINVYGSGTAYVDVERDLNIKLFGSGNVLYKGSPSIQSQSYGAGKVKAM